MLIRILLESEKCKVYLVMALLSTIVAAIGLQRDNVPIIIGAMVIAPFLGPNMALALATTLGDLTLLRRPVALASGCAGAIAFSSGVSAILIGVKVAVSLLPPVVAFGLLLGNGQLLFASGALLLFLINLVCVNLAAIVTFLIQGIHPKTWWEKDRAIKATRVALILWALLLAILASLILVLPKEVF